MRMAFSALVRGTHADLLADIGKTKDLSDANAAKLKGIVEGFTKSFA